MREKIIPSAIIIVMLASLLIPMAIAQPPMPPCWFYGTVNVEGLPAQDNLNVTAVIKGTSLSWTTKTKNGTYGWTQSGSSSFYIPSDVPTTPEKDGGVNGDIIEFYINEVKTNQTAIFEYMSLKRVDLTVGSIHTDTHNIIFSSSPAIAPITIDGIVHTTAQLPAIKTWSNNTFHTFSVEPTVSGTTGIQYVFTSWSDNNTQTSRSIIASTSASYTANFKTQYLLTVVSDQGSASGGDWYDEGATAYATLDKGTVSAGLIENWVFIGWSGDVSETSLTSNAIVMDGPKTVTGQWVKQFNVNFYTIIIGVAVVAVGVVWVTIKRRSKPLSTPTRQDAHAHTSTKHRKKNTTKNNSNSFACAIEMI